MYSRTIWQDEVVEYPYRYKETVNGDGTVEHEARPGTVLQEGTPQSATNFNNMENGIEDTRIAEAIQLQYAMHQYPENDARLDDLVLANMILSQSEIQSRYDVNRRLDEHDEEFSAETGTVTLTNTAKTFFGFNNSGKTISLTQVRNTMNYDLDIEVTSFSGGQLADVVVYDKQLNGFKLRFEGSAASVTVKYKVRGGMYA